MSTKIQDSHDEDDSLTVKNLTASNNAYFSSIDSGDEAEIVVTKDDLKNALRKEFGWIVIDESELPEVRQETGIEGRLSAGAAFQVSVDATVAREVASSYLAIAEYLDAQPKIDPADVEALATLLGESFGGTGYKDAARKLLASGKVEVKK